MLRFLIPLAFVLLIISIITTPLLEKGLPINLPEGGQPEERVEKRSVRTVEITDRGAYLYNSRPITLPSASLSFQPSSGLRNRLIGPPGASPTASPFTINAPFVLGGRPDGRTPSERSTRLASPAR